MASPSETSTTATPAPAADAPAPHAPPADAPAPHALPADTLATHTPATDAPDPHAPPADASVADAPATVATVTDALKLAVGDAHAVDKSDAMEAVRPDTTRDEGLEEASAPASDQDPQSSARAAIPFEPVEQAPADETKTPLEAGPEHDRIQEVLASINQDTRPSTSAAERKKPAPAYDRQELEQYLEDKGVRRVFEAVIERLYLEQPDNVLDTMAAVFRDEQQAAQARPS
ncbi:uncharacterized protein MONBRDRAFT_6085 [Monosiga brevicollis MX1]|uniref:Uncharacterized protein n=1 Tax=Monosiga brevicollis TaxID=81824 RepID=A9URJ1_MONBE|nr:uncharacterized protein MONBRDRAFT_6085 [Monosiga brevicollis MX1]EDQ91932.1 predicted protein [Monosiga brevicollis MX1]|eukprot:XP_001743218.1 hypothetical protein [Monosiga brevicollis MX1]